MTDPTRREEYDSPWKTRLERYFQDGGCEGGWLGLCWIPIATRRALCFHPRRLDAERAVRPVRVAVRAAESRPFMVTQRHGFNRLREEVESLQREIESGAGGGDPGDSPTRPRR